ncbi:MAG: hypothetical protein KDA61_15800, partial [Planctomycetales bacterium]|nr:hypothetical protein [Planctomycetales bacterium]
DALRRALQLDPTAIVLFTDGAPSKRLRQGSGDWLLDVAQMDDIPRLLANQSPNVPVNVVAVSDYFERNFAKFLLNIANQTGGGFVGL